MTLYAQDEDGACVCVDHLGQPIAAMAATHRAALDKVDWPEVWR